MLGFLTSEFLVVLFFWAGFDFAGLREIVCVDMVH